MNKNNVWFITAETNLHVGNENSSSYGIIDLAVQRHATTGLPCINSSSLKGALNEFASQQTSLSPDDQIDIFGCDKKGRKNETRKGKYTFFDAEILFLPRQSEQNLYELVTCEDVLKRFFRYVELLTGEKYNVDNLKQMGFKYEIIDNRVFKENCSDDNLPIIARNVLDNGESKNLWYEQVVPSQSVFYTIIDDTLDDKKKLSSEINNKLIQIGANATIGYGYCRFQNQK